MQIQTLEFAVIEVKVMDGLKAGNQALATLKNVFPALLALKPLAAVLKLSPLAFFCYLFV